MRPFHCHYLHKGLFLISRSKHRKVRAGKNRLFIRGTRVNRIYWNFFNAGTFAWGWGWDISAEAPFVFSLIVCTLEWKGRFSFWPFWRPLPSTLGMVFMCTNLGGAQLNCGFVNRRDDGIWMLDLSAQSMNGLRSYSTVSTRIRMLLLKKKWNSKVNRLSGCWLSAP